MLFRSRRRGFYDRARLRDVAVLLKIACILVEWNGDDSSEDCEDAVLCFVALFEFNVLVPEGMR